MSTLGFTLGTSFGDDADAAVASAPVPRARNIYVDPLTGQFALDGAGNLRMVYDGDSVVQACRCALQLFLGEWYLDDAEGLDWLGRVLVKNPVDAVIREEVRRVLLKVAGVTDVVSVDLTYDRPARALDVAFVVKADAGLLSGTLTSPGGS